MGALGVAILSKETPEINFSFDIITDNFKTTSTNCGSCPNNCEIIRIEKNSHLIDSWGNRCERGKIKVKLTIWCLYAVEKWDMELELTDSYVSVNSIQ